MRKYKTIILYTLVIAILVIIVVYRAELKNIIEQFAIWTYPNEENRNGEVIKLIINIIGGIVILIGLRAALIRAKSSQKSTEIQYESIKNQTNQIELTRDSQINEQFKNAIEHLGSNEESIILGGISELHFIATEHPDKFRQVVLNILCSKLRAEAYVKKDAKEINKTIIQTIIDYILKTEVYSKLSTDLSFCNLHNINFDSTKIENCNLSFSKIPWRMNNVEFVNCNLGSIHSTVGRYENLKFLRSSLFNAYFQSAEFKDSIIYNDDDKLQKMTCLNCKFDGFTFNCSIYNSKLLSCEFDFAQFSVNKISSVNFTASSFNQIEFGMTEISNCNFSGCGFVKTSAKSWIQSCLFAGIKNDHKYYSHFLEKQLDTSIAHSNNFLGFDYNQELFINNSVTEMTTELKEKSLAFYDKTIADRKEKIEKSSS